MLRFEFAFRDDRDVDRFDGAAFEGSGQLGETPSGDICMGFVVGPHSPKLDRKVCPHCSRSHSVWTSDCAGQAVEKSLSAWSQGDRHHARPDVCTDGGTDFAHRDLALAQ